MKRIGNAADMRLRSDSDLLRLAAIPDRVYDPTKAGDVIPCHAKLLLEVLNQNAVATTQRVYGSRIVTSADSMAARLGAQTHDWYTLAKATDLDEDYAIALQSAITVLNASYMAWGAAVFASRTERWQSQTEEGDERKKAATEEIVARRERLTTTIKTAIDALGPAPRLVDPFVQYWESIVTAIQTRAEGIASVDGAPLRAWNVRCLQIGDIARELGRQIDDGHVATA